MDINFVGKNKKNDYDINFLIVWIFFYFTIRDNIYMTYVCYV